MENIRDKAFKFAKRNKREIINRFIDVSIKSNERPIFIFMAGAPGAGKTETSKWLINILKKKSLSDGIVRIDADEVREIFRPIGYNGKNSDNYKRGCVKGLEILYDACIKNRYHTLVDGTFSSFSVAQKNIQAAIKIKAAIYLVYVYQDPLTAWGFTKIREKEEGRRIKKEMFISSFFKSISNVNKVKIKYRDKIELWLVEKEITNETKKIRLNIDKIDNYLKIKYNSKELSKIIYE